MSLFFLHGKKKLIIGRKSNKIPPDIFNHLTVLQILTAGKITLDSMQDRSRLFKRWFKEKKFQEIFTPSTLTLLLSVDGY